MKSAVEYRAKPSAMFALTDRVATDWSGPRAELNDVAYLQFTSGSTGQLGAQQRPAL